MSCTTSVGLIIILAIIASVYSISVKNENVIRWKQQIASTKAFKCQPRPRSFRASEIFKELKGDHYTIPREAILHRCDSHSGCCHDQGVCAMKSSEIVELAFFSNKIADILMVKAKNHTSCSCRSMN
ncbi:hypothetical protein QE152_g10256 [Popillia japonica]|uniref:Platelet-derived growth factor (PDGF) family profile domain-containing protein n=1 Tax=Popillia japonica TaxID=7064 RepID=A0AAW1LS05_POPJA